MINKKCEFCGGEYKNVSVHQRFCKAKKEALEKGEKIPEKEEIIEGVEQKPTLNKEKAEEINKKLKELKIIEDKVSTSESLEEIAEKAKIEQEAISEAISPTIPEKEKITEEQVDLVTKTLEKTEALSTEDKKEEELEINDAMKDAMKDIGVIKVKDESLIKEAESTEGQKAIFKEELVIEFNEPKDSWERKLCDIFEQVDSGKEIHIKLYGELSHEFVITDGTYRYPSDVFINVIRTYSSSFKDQVNNLGGQTFVCKRK